MPDQDIDAESALRKLGQRLRDGWAKKHPTPENTIDAVKDVVRQQWEREQAVKRIKPPPQRPKTRDRQPPEPEP